MCTLTPRHTYKTCVCMQGSSFASSLASCTPGQVGLKDQASNRQRERQRESERARERVKKDMMYKGSTAIAPSGSPAKPPKHKHRPDRLL